jgi:hypothetical protein
MKQDFLNWWKFLPEEIRKYFGDKFQFEDTNLSYNQIFEFITKIKNLSVDQLFGKDLSFISGLQSLETLLIEEENNIESLTGIESLTNLKELNLSSAHHCKIGPEVRTLYKLEIIYLPKSINDISELAYIKSLKEIIFHLDTKTISLTPIQGLAELTKVILPNSISDISSLLVLRKLLLVSSFCMSADDPQVKVLLRFNPDCEFRDKNWKKYIDRFFDNLIIPEDGNQI